MVILEKDHARFVQLLEQLRQQANARFVTLVDKTGQQIAAQGDSDDADPTSLASLTAGNVAATEGLAQLVGEAGFTSLYHEGTNRNLYLSVVGEKVILLVVFDEMSSLGLVRLRAQQHAEAFSAIVLEITGRGDERTQAAQAVTASAFADFSDEDIDALFG